MLVSYCVVNTNGRELLLACLDAIERTTPPDLDHEGHAAQLRVRVECRQRWQSAERLQVKAGRGAGDGAEDGTRSAAALAEASAVLGCEAAATRGSATMDREGGRSGNQ